VWHPLRRLLPLPAKNALRRLWLLVARRLHYPISSPRTRRPPLPSPRRPLRLTHVVLACDLNPEYLGFWPSTKRAWREIAAVEPVLVLIAEPEQVPQELRDDAAVVPLAPVDGVHTTFQAQCIRLLYPALLETDGGVLISDIDLYPLRPSYFHDPVRLLDERFFVTYRDTRLHRGEIAITFNAAAPATWGDVFAVDGAAAVSERLREWAARYPYDGRRGEAGWYSDQHILFDALQAWPAHGERHWTLDDDYTRFNRLDRLELVHEDGLLPHRRRGLRALRYSDYNCLIPYTEHRAVNDLVLELGLDAVRTRRG
jgi:hypothetical protein